MHFQATTPLLLSLLATLFLTTAAQPVKSAYPEDPAYPETPTYPKDPTYPETPAYPKDPTYPETPTYPKDPTYPFFLPPSFWQDPTHHHPLRLSSSDSLTACLCDQLVFSLKMYSSTDSTHELHRPLDGVNPEDRKDAPLGPEGIRWTLASGASTETQTYYVALDDGCFFFLQVAYANFGFGPNVQLSYRYYDPKNPSISDFRSANLSASKFKLSEDNRSFHMNEVSSSTKDGHNFSVLLSFKEKAQFTLTAETEAFRLGKGRTTFGVGEDASYIAHDWVLQSRSEGIITLKDRSTRSLNGTATLVHAIQRGRPYALATKWRFAVAYGKRLTCNMISFQTSEKWGSQWVGQSGIAIDGKMLGATDQVFGEPDGEEEDVVSGYSIPTGQTYWCEGILSDGRPCKVKFHAPMKQLVERIDLLAQLPWMLRKVIQTFVTRPFLYQWWETVKATITLGDEVIEEDIQLLQEASFMR
ncbi:Svf1-like-domain-containing protein [Piptocephalis cylindrospora]|uniref:Svf1-like-domain-containing protein n=1 Tax=Piptocephalis cylindrospora TaxID=1907219 RepID=A0A4P9Y1L0_9FUNG|nr:Svf1-like-domain-containing protein [Piptocephalis cylindrospora]|eukprot:RKP12677.1 Svf1-like-domain-containing protein [Piptocephalis cylindrospora]